MSDDRFLPYGRQCVDEEDIQAVAEAMRSDYLTTGPRVEAFECALAEISGVRHAAAVSSGTAALHAAYVAAGLGPGDEIVTTPLTFAATANAALWCGAKVRFADIDPATGNLSPERAAEAISPRTRLVVPVDYTGLPADYDRFSELGRHHGVRIVSDASHSLGATYKGRPVGALADLTVTSFHPVKAVTSAEGGAVLTNSSDFHEKVTQFRNHGIRTDSSEQERVGDWYKGMTSLGLNYRLSDVHCALGLSQLKKLDRFIARRWEIADKYLDQLKGIDGLELPSYGCTSESAWHLFVVQVPAEVRRAFFERLRESGLGVQVHYLPVYWHPYWENLGYTRGQCPAAESRYSRSISLPIYPGMSAEDVDSVVQRVQRVSEELSRAQQ